MKCPQFPILCPQMCPQLLPDCGKLCRTLTEAKQGEKPVYRGEIKKSRKAANLAGLWFGATNRNRTCI